MERDRCWTLNWSPQNISNYDDMFYSSYLILHISRFPNWAALLRIVSCFKREFPWCIYYTRYIIYNFLSFAARVLRDQKRMWSVCRLLWYHDKKWKKKHIFSSTGTISWFKWWMLSFKEQDIFHISSDTLTTLIWERKIALLQRETTSVQIPLFYGLPFGIMALSCLTHEV